MVGMARRKLPCPEPFLHPWRSLSHLSPMGNLMQGACGAEAMVLSSACAAKSTQGPRVASPFRFLLSLVVNWRSWGLPKCGNAGCFNRTEPL